MVPYSTFGTDSDCCEVFEPLLNDFTSFREESATKLLECCLQLISSFEIEHLSLKNSIIKESEFIIQAFYEIQSTFIKENGKFSCGFNILKFFDPSETMHSRLIGYLLNPNESHGQNKKFLQVFLKKLKIENPEQGNWLVTIEKGRIDILLKRTDPLSVIVIENKAKEAIDQENQMYRYWLKTMFFPYIGRHNNVRYTLDMKQYFRLVYLTPSVSKIPDVSSLSRPDWPVLEQYQQLPERLDKNDIDIWLFQDQYVNFMNQCILELDPDNHRMKEFLNQNIEYWSH